MSQASTTADVWPLGMLYSSWAAFNFSHCSDFYQYLQDTPVPFVPFTVTLWSILFWAICMLVIAPRALGVLFSIVIFFVARIPGVRLTIAKISMIDGFQDIKFHYDVPEMNVSVSVDAIKLRPWFYAPDLVGKPRKIFVGLIERPEIILCIKTAEQDVQSSSEKPSNNAQRADSSQNGVISKLLKLSMTLFEMSISKMSLKATRDRKNELLAIDCLRTSILGNYFSDLEVPTQSPKRVQILRSFRRSVKANSLFYPEILSQNFSCQIQYTQHSEFIKKPTSSSRAVEIKSSANVSGGLPPPAPPPPPVNSLWKLLTFSPWRPPLGIDKFNNGCTREDVYSMASDLNRREIPAVFSISSFSLIGRSHGNLEEKPSLKWDLIVSPLCFVCCLDHLQNSSFFSQSSVVKAPAVSVQSQPNFVRQLLADLPPIFPLSCTFEKIILCAAFSVSDSLFSGSISKEPKPIFLDAFQISVDKTLISCVSSVSLDGNSGTSAVRGQVSVNAAFESVQGSVLSVSESSLLDLGKFECSIKLSSGQASGNTGLRSIAADAKVSRPINRRARKPSADTKQMAFIASDAAGADEYVSLEIQIVGAELALMVTNPVLLASAHCFQHVLRLSSSKSAAATVSTDSTSKSQSHITIKCQINSVVIMLGDFSRQKDAMTEIACVHWTTCFSQEPGNFSNEIRNFSSESSKISVKYSIGLEPALRSHCLHGVYLEKSNEIISLQNCKFSSNSSNSNSIEVKSIIILLSEPVIIDFALAIKSIFGEALVYASALSNTAKSEDIAHRNSSIIPALFRLDVKNVELTLFYDCSEFAARVVRREGASFDDAWLSLFHVVCSDIYFERAYKIGKSALHHQFSLGKINSFYISPQVHGAVGQKPVAAEHFIGKSASVLQFFDFNRIKVEVEEKLTHTHINALTHSHTPLLIASIHAHGALDGGECVNLNLECVTALLSARDTLLRLSELFNFGLSNPPSDVLKEPSSPELWFAMDCDFMSLAFSATPRSKIQTSFAVLSVRRQALSPDDENGDVVSAGPYAAFFDSIYEQQTLNAGSSAIVAVVASDFRVNYLSRVAVESAPFSSFNIQKYKTANTNGSFRLGSDVSACENILAIGTVAFTLPSNPASEYSEEKLRAMLQSQDTVVLDEEDERLKCPPLDHITLQITNVLINAFISPTTTVLGRNVLKNKPFGLVDFGMIMDDTLLAIKAIQSISIDGTTNKVYSKRDSDRKLALCLFVKQVKLLVKEHRFGVDKNGEVRVSGQGWFWALHCLHQDELIEREKRWTEVQKMIKLQKVKLFSSDDKELIHAFNSENATIWKERVKKLKEQLRHQSDVIPSLCVMSVDHIVVGFTSWSQGPLINSMLEKLDDSGAKRGAFQSELLPDFDDVYGGLIFGIISTFCIHLRAFEKPLMKFENYEWGGKVVIAEERSASDILMPCSINIKPEWGGKVVIAEERSASDVSMPSSINIKPASPKYAITVLRSCLPMKLYHQTQATIRGFCLFYGSAHAQCISMMGAALGSLSPPSPAAIAPMLPFDKLRLMLHGSSEVKFIPAVNNGPAIEVLLSISNSPQSFGDSVQFSFESAKLDTSLAKLSLECRGVSVNFLYGEKLIWPVLSSQEMKVIVFFDWICLGSSYKHHFNQIIKQVQADGGSLRSMMGKGDLLPTFRSAGVRLRIDLDTVNTVLRLHVDSLNFIFRVLNSLDGVGNSFLQFKSFHTADGFYFSLPERTKPFGQHIVSINIVFKAEPVAIFCFYSGPMPSRQSCAVTIKAKSPARSELHHGVFRFATKLFVFKLEQCHVLQPASKYDQRMAIMMQSDDVPRKLEWVINALEVETKMLSIYDVGFHHNCDGWYGDGNSLVLPSPSGPHASRRNTLSADVPDGEKEVHKHFNFLEYRCRCFEQCALDKRVCDVHHIIATSVGVKLAARSEKTDGPHGSGESQKSSGHSQRSASISEDVIEGRFAKKSLGSDVRDRTRLWVGGLAVGEAGVRAAANVSTSSPTAVLSELLKKPLSAVIKSEDRYFVPPSFKCLGPSSPKVRIIDARDMILDIVAESLFVQITYENRYAYSVWSNGLRCSFKDERVKRRNEDGYVQLSEAEIKWRRFLDPAEETIGSNLKTSDARGKLAVPEQWQHCNEFQGTISRMVWRLKLKEPQLGIEAFPPERQGKNFQCRLQHRLLLTGKTGQILNMAVRFADKKDKCWKVPRSHTSLVMDGIIVRMAAENITVDESIPTSRRSQNSTGARRMSVGGGQLKDAPDENTFLLTKLWGNVVWVTGDAARNAEQQIVMESPYLRFSFYSDVDAPSSIKSASDSLKENPYVQSKTHVDLLSGNVVSVLIKEVKIVTDCVQFRVFSEVISGLLRPLPTETEADDMREALRLNALLDVNQMLRIKKIEMDINILKRQLDESMSSKMEDNRREELSRLEAQLRQLTQAGQEQLSEQRLRFLSYHLLNCSWELRAKEQEIDAAFEKGVRVGSHGSPDQITTFSRVQFDDVFGSVSYATTEPQGFSFRVRSFKMYDQTSERPRLGEYVFQPREFIEEEEGRSQSSDDNLSEVQAEVRNASYIAAAIQKFLGSGTDTNGPQGSYSDQSDIEQQMINIEIFKSAERCNGLDTYERFSIDIAAMRVAIPHELFVLIYDFIFEAEKKAFLQSAFDDLQEEVVRDTEAHSAEVARLHANEQMPEIKNRTFNHIFNRVEVSRLNVLVSYKGPSLSWNLRDINDLEVSIANFLLENERITWATLFDNFQKHVTSALLDQAPKVARHKLSDLFSRKKHTAALSSSKQTSSFGGSASAPVTPMVSDRGDVHFPRSAGDKGGGAAR